MVILDASRAINPDVNSQTSLSASWPSGWGSVAGQPAATAICLEGQAARRAVPLSWLCCANHCRATDAPDQFWHETFLAIRCPHFPGILNALLGNGRRMFTCTRGGAEKWSSDIIYIRTHVEPPHLAVVMDLFFQRVIGPLSRSVRNGGPCSISQSGSVEVLTGPRLFGNVGCNLSKPK